MKSQQSRSRNSSRESRRSSGGGGKQSSTAETTKQNSISGNSSSSGQPQHQHQEYTNRDDPKGGSQPQEYGGSYNDNDDNDQPEYINIDSLKSAGIAVGSSQTAAAAAAVRSESAVGAAWMVTTASKLSSAIGPDDWYRDDFNFDKSHPFMEDPLLLQQYAQVLDMRFRDAAAGSGGRYAAAVADEEDRLEALIRLQQRQQQHLGGAAVSAVGPHNNNNNGRYPDSGYDTLRMRLSPDRQQVCIDIENEDEQESRLSSLSTSSTTMGVKMRQREATTTTAPATTSRRAQTWHSSSSHFADFQLLEKENSTVLLSIQGQEEDLPTTTNKRSPRGPADSHKMDWSPSKSAGGTTYQEIRKVKEAPPKNVVRERLKSFERAQQEEEEEEAKVKAQEATVEEEDRRRSLRLKKQQQVGKGRAAAVRHRSKSVNYSSEEEGGGNYDGGSSARPLEKKRSVKDLLFDFEQKTKELQQQTADKEEFARDNVNSGGIGSYLLQDSSARDNASRDGIGSTRDNVSSGGIGCARDNVSSISIGSSYLLQDSSARDRTPAASNRRRVFSDTETLMYETSSDEANSSDFSGQRKSTYQEANEMTRPAGGGEQREARGERQGMMPASASAMALRDPPPLPPKNHVPVSEQNWSQSEESQYQAMTRVNGTARQDVFSSRPASSLGEEQPQHAHQQDLEPRGGGEVTEETYLAMTPSKSLNSLQHNHQLTPQAGSVGGRKHSGSGTLVTSRTSLTSSHSSLQSLNRFGSDKNLLGSMTPTEALIATATSSTSLVAVQHSRTPSQSLVMEHLQLQEEARRLEEETYVDMNEDGSYASNRLQQLEKRMRGLAVEPILARQHWRDQEEHQLDTTLTGGGDQTESPRYCEIEDAALTESAHYEYLYRATSLVTHHHQQQQQQQQHYEVVYQEIPDNDNKKEKNINNVGNSNIGENRIKQDSRTRREPEPLRPIEGLPDILGNAPTNKGNSSSDADDESSKDFDIDVKQHQQQQLQHTQSRLTTTTILQNKITLDDSFRPASFYLSHSKNSGAGGADDDADDTDDSDLVSPPPVPSSPPPMEEVLGHQSHNNLDVPCPPANLNNILAAAKSAHAIREQNRRDSVEEDLNRRPSVGSRTSYGSHNSLLSQHGSQQSLNHNSNFNSQELGLPHTPTHHHQQQQRFLHGSHQSLSSRELPPLPTGATSQLGSQQSLASKEIQLIGSANSNGGQTGATMMNNEGMRSSPFHSREGSLDNEMFLYHRFTQGSSIGDPYRKQQSSDEFSSSDTTTTNYEQEYRKYHLENIQEVSNTLERTDAHNTSVISQDLNISYNSVYDSRLQQSKVYRIEDHPALKKRKSLDERQENSSVFNLPPDQPMHQQGEQQDSSILTSPRSKVPYYVSDIIEDDDNVSASDLASLNFHHHNMAMSAAALPSAGTMVDVITKSMNALDMESNSYFESRNEVENERIRKLRRSYTPDPYNGSKGRAGSAAGVGAGNSRPLSPETSASQQQQQHFEGNNAVSRSKSLEGLLGDSPGTPKDNLGYNAMATGHQASRVYSPHNFNDIPVRPKPARGHQPPPPPDGVPPLDIRPLTSPAIQRGQVQYTGTPVAAAGGGGRDPNLAAEDEMWADTLRKTSLRHQAVRSPELLQAGSSSHHHHHQGRHSVTGEERSPGCAPAWGDEPWAGRHSVTPGRRGPAEGDPQQQQLQPRGSGGRPAIPPPTAPKPKTPVPFPVGDAPVYMNTHSNQAVAGTVPVRRNASAANLLEPHQQQQFFPNEQVADYNSTTLDRYGWQQPHRNIAEPNNNNHSNSSNSVQGTFLEFGLPAPISREGVVGGRLPADPARSMTLPARTRSSTDNSSKSHHNSSSSSSSTLQRGQAEADGSTTTPRNSRSGGLPPDQGRLLLQQQSSTTAPMGPPSIARSTPTTAPASATTAPAATASHRESGPVRQASTGRTRLFQLTRN